MRHADRDVRPLDVAEHADAALRTPSRHLVVDTERRGRARTGEPVHRNPLEDWGVASALSAELKHLRRISRLTFIIRPGIFVRPAD